MKRESCLTLLLSILVFLPNFSPAQTTTTYDNPGTILISDNSVASPYPSTITVPAGPPCMITTLTAALNGFNHPFPDDVGVLLVGPSGQTVRLMVDVGGGTISGMSVPANLIFQDAPPAVPIPDEGGGLVSGTYQPSVGVISTTSNPHPANFVAPAPAGPYGTTMSVFNGTSAVGVWSLFADDDTPVDGGTIDAGWSLTITCVPASAATVSISGRVSAPNGRGIGRARIAITDQYGETRTVRTNAFGYYLLDDVRAGESYIVGVSAKGFQSVQQFVTVEDSITDFDFIVERLRKPAR